MKKPYSKPFLHFEDFTLSASIAAGCTYEANYTVDSCDYKYNGISIFLDSNVCDWTAQDGDNSLCYHVPSDGIKIFTS